MTNFVAALAQIEAAMEVLRAQNRGHLVIISSFSAVRGLRGGPATYAATKRHRASRRGPASRAARSPIDVTVVYPGYIRTEMTADQTHAPFTVDVEPGVRAMVSGIEKRAATVYAPTLPWAPLSVVMRLLPLAAVARLAKPPRGE
jgi:short-subunit dehydrogenase